MGTVQFFVPSQSYLQKVEDLFEDHRKKILYLVPTAKVEHIGATSVPGLLTKGDLDLQVSVSLLEFDRAVGILQTEYSDRQLENWTESFASFKVERDSDISVGVQLVIQGSESDIFDRSTYHHTSFAICFEIRSHHCLPEVIDSTRFDDML